jgi:hypothetical protein
MNLNKRIAGLEREYGRPSGVRTIIWVGGKDEQVTRSIVERCHAEGVRIRAIAFEVKQDAASLEEANAIVERHKAAHAHTAISVYLKDDDGRTVLASYKPALPWWFVKGNSPESEPE